jgi:hypothetical protein
MNLSIFRPGNRFSPFSLFCRASVFSLMLFILGCRDKACDNVKCIHGTCVDGKCECEEGWGGPVCASVPCTPECINGHCNNGICACDAGWEGADCSQRARDKFLGAYLVAETCGSAGDNYPLTVSGHATETGKFLFSNLHRSGALPYSVYATVNTNGESFTIPMQTVAAVYKISGGGTFDKSSLNIIMNFTIRDLAGSPTETCSAILDRL